MYRFIFEIRPHEGRTDDYINAWKKGSTIIQRQPGAKGTRLFHNLDDPNTLTAMADWEDKPARDKGMANVSNLPPEELSVTKAHRQYADITIIGKYELTAEVLPQTD